MGDDDDDDAGDIMGEDDVGDGVGDGTILRRGKSFGSDRVTSGVCAAVAGDDNAGSSPAPMILSKACCRFLGTMSSLLLLLLLLLLSLSSLSIAWRIR